MIDISNNLKSRLRNLGFVAACLIVTIHMPTNGMFKTILSNGIAQAMVPIFFLISGLFASASISKYGWRTLFHKKFFSLVVPYVLLNLIVYGFACAELLGGRTWSFSPKMTEISFNTLLLSLGIAKTRWCFLYPLWYVRCLIFLFCLAPLLWWLLSRGRLCAILTLSIIFILDAIAFVLGLNNEKIILLSFWFSTTGLLCFSLGMTIGMNHDKLKSITALCACSPARKFACIGGGGLTLCVIACALSSHSDLNLIVAACKYYFVLPTVAISLFLLMPAQRFPEFLLRNTFGLYVLHALMIHYSHFLKLPINNDLSRCLYWICVTTISIALSELLHRAFPRTTGLLLGGR